MLSAEIQTTTLIRSLLIALVVVAPYGIYKWRQVQARRAELAALDAPDPEPESVDPRPRLEDVIAQIDQLGASVGDGPLTVLVPADATVDGQPVPAALADALVRDALARSGLVATAELDSADGRRLECARIRRDAPG